MKQQISRRHSFCNGIPGVFRVGRETEKDLLSGIWREQFLIRSYLFSDSREFQNRERILPWTFKKDLPPLTRDLDLVGETIFGWRVDTPADEFHFVLYDVYKMWTFDLIHSNSRSRDLQCKQRGLNVLVIVFCSVALLLTLNIVIGTFACCPVEYRRDGLEGENLLKVNSTIRFKKNIDAVFHSVETQFTVVSLAGRGPWPFSGSWELGWLAGLEPGHAGPNYPM